MRYCKGIDVDKYAEKVIEFAEVMTVIALFLLGYSVRRFTCRIVIVISRFLQHLKQYSHWNQPIHIRLVKSKWIGKCGLNWLQVKIQKGQACRQSDG